MLFIDNAWPTKLLEKSMNLFKKPPRLVLIMVFTQLVVLVLSFATTNNALAVDQKNRHAKLLRISVTQTAMIAPG